MDMSIGCTLRWVRARAIGHLMRMGWTEERAERAVTAITELVERDDGSTQRTSGVRGPEPERA